MRSILLILVFWVNFNMLYQPVMVVCLSMRSRWGKEWGIGHKIDEKNVKILKNDVFFRKEFWFYAAWGASCYSGASLALGH